ncbi:WD40-repeat-containing domain protein [Xylaria bambusicola]|uniref:WD40-repeat-containing domain protein n=1 Tax=Xylaria bambusicola TaxID=326684 RepID=UPI002008B4DE|nr:WD40-repeat-containing domain protein [Xylaria bambusicola]KAI0509219.1 WD40-repeat-containing domain protein [Xylaria bambusicola]
MSSSRSQSEELDDQHTDPYFDAEEHDEDEDEDADYNDDNDEEEDEDDEQDEDDMNHDLFDEDDEFHDADDGGLQFIVQVEGGDEGEGGEASEEAAAEQSAIERRVINLIANVGRRAGLVSQRELLNLLRGRNLGIILNSDGNDDDGDFDNWGHRLRRRRQLDPNRFPKVPSDKGRELMNSGTFGANDISSPLRKKKQLARRILDRELGIGDRSYRGVNQGVIAQSMIPRTDADMIIYYDDNVYSGQFSDDGNFFYACVKDFKVRMYDTSNPYNWRHYKTVEFPFGSWTLTDASLSPDNKWLAYTSIQSNVCLAPTDPNDTGDPYTLSLSEYGARRGTWRDSFGIWSIRFSGDGRELVAGTNARSIIVYDIESRRVLHHIEGHEDDVNAVCFADKSSPHILYSGSDDTTIKVWDRRSMGDGREAGAFVGHIEGLTYMDSKDDGRYLLSNGKDQSMKLWDLKMMYTSAQFIEKNPRQHVPYSDFDYRWNKFDENDWFPHPDDNSVVTFRGHKVLRTLIRCHFSPPTSTDSRYVYSGSHDGKVYIWNLDATLAGVIDVQKTTSAEKSLSRRYRSYYNRRGLPGWTTVVRDASWHPTAPFIAASSLNGWDHQLGTVTLHGYNEGNLDEGFPEMGTSYDEKLRRVSGNSDEEDDEEEEEESDGLGI